MISEGKETDRLSEYKVKLFVGDWLNHLGFQIFDEKENMLSLNNPMDKVSYQFNQEYVVRGLDTFNIQIQHKEFLFDAIKVEGGRIDAIRLKTSKEFQQKELFIFKRNSAKHYMD